MLSLSVSDVNISAFIRHFRLPMVDEMAWGHFRLSLCGRHPGFAISTICVILSEIYILPDSVAILLFPVVQVTVEITVLNSPWW